MSKVVLAEYLAEQRMLKLEQPLEGVTDHEQLRVAIERQDVAPVADPAWMRLAGSLSPEAGDTLAKAIDDAFGRIDD